MLQDQATTRFLYSGGLFVAASLDATIDEITVQEASLDDLMFRLAERAKREPDFTLTRNTLEEELRDLTDRDFGPWLDQHVYGQTPPRLPDYITREMSGR